MSLYPTPHINAAPEDFSETVLMPGDPLRAKFIAENYLTDAVCINKVRGALAYTGYYKGKKISVMASGMGMPSMGIYSYELYNIFGVKRIMRIGSAGAIRSDIKVRDIVIAMGACTTSSFATQYNLPGSFAPICSYEMLKTCTENAEKLGIRYHVGNILTSDTFYTDTAGLTDENLPSSAWGRMNVTAIEMETAALYMTAARAGCEALAICTVSDHLLTGEATSAEERQNSFTDMITLALDTGAELIGD